MAGKVDTQTGFGPDMKELVSSDRSKRDNAVSQLRNYLTAPRQLSKLDMLKLWKGMWMSDRPRTQQRLAADLAGFTDCLPEKNVMLFMEAFWTTMAAEWGGIDALRLDKFLLLVRRCLNASFEYLARRDWDTKTVKEYMGILESIPLSATNRTVADGLRYHVIDIYVDELDKVDRKSGATDVDSDSVPRSGLVDLDLVLSPLRSLRDNSPSKVVRTRVKEALSDPRLETWTASQADADGEPRTARGGDDPADEEWGGLDD
ncbi:MAG: hypothetical protein M1833_007105 [Piccolia ochrophora]|nr:MAG: hypothetical protein M1833_007105 [Piccolia ochrophora]